MQDDKDNNNNEMEVEGARSDRVLSDKQSQENLPWVEKYRPSDLNQLISHEEIISTST